MMDITDMVRSVFKITAACFILMTHLLIGCEQPAMIPDFGRIQDTQEKKMLFFSFMTPLVKAENNRILRKRKKLIRLHEIHMSTSRLTLTDTKWLNALASEYDADKGKEIPWQLLLRRVDAVPLELALVQAAKESGWGTSRFAREGYNMFGEYCYHEGCGIVPGERDDGAQHEVAVFRSVTDSVHSYLHNLNTHDAYLNFRMMRHRLREEGKPLDGHALAGTLPMYSEEREHYVVEVRHMINENLHLIDKQL